MFQAYLAQIPQQNGNLIQCRTREGGQRMEEEVDRSGWRPQPLRKHQPPMILPQVCGCSSSFLVAQGQPVARDKGLGSLVTSWVISLSSLNRHRTNHTCLRREGKMHVGQDSFARCLLSTMVLLFYKLQSPTSSWGYHSLGPASHTRISEE